MPARRGRASVAFRFPSIARSRLSSTFRRGGPPLAGLAVLCALGGSAGAAPAGAASGASGGQRLVVLLSSHRAHAGADARSPLIADVKAMRPITGEPTTLPVIGAAVGSDGTNWLRVMLPGRPNGSTGWITGSGTRELATAWRLVIHLASRRVQAYRDGHLARTFSAVVGKPSTPTPVGSFFVEETLRMRSTEPGGPFALALSARSDVLQEFDGGPGQIAIHGRDGLGGTLGTAASHGCIRLSTGNIDWLAGRIGAGVPVRIVA
jgi:lipoprotein-anchoring transpeptidase ErfK/SrfK